jgi:beta-glucosidase
MKRTKIALIIGLFIYNTVATAQKLPYQNPDLPPEERAGDLIGRLTLEEKAALMCDISDAIPPQSLRDE